MFYRFARLLVAAFYHILFRITVVGHGNIPVTGPVVLCSNHTSNHDPLILGISVKRPVHFLAKSEMYRFKPFRPILRAINTIPTNRDQVDIKTFKAAMNALSEGHVLGVFAQGHRFKELDADDAKSGAAMFALKSGAALVPVKIDGGYRLFSRVLVMFGEPLDLSEYKEKKVRSETLRQVTELLVERILSL